MYRRTFNKLAILNMIGLPVMSNISNGADHTIETYRDYINREILNLFPVVNITRLNSTVIHTNGSIYGVLYVPRFYNTMETMYIPLAYDNLSDISASECIGILISCVPQKTFYDPLHTKNITIDLKRYGPMTGWYKQYLKNKEKLSITVDTKNSGCMRLYYHHSGKYGLMALDASYFHVSIK